MSTVAGASAAVSLGFLSSNNNNSIKSISYISSNKLKVSPELGGGNGPSDGGAGTTGGLILHLSSPHLQQHTIMHFTNSISYLSTCQ